MFSDIFIASFSSIYALNSGVITSFFSKFILFGDHSSFSSFTISSRLITPICFSSPFSFLHFHLPPCHFLQAPQDQHVHKHTHDFSHFLPNIIPTKIFSSLYIFALLQIMLYVQEYSYMCWQLKVLLDTNFFFLTFKENYFLLFWNFKMSLQFVFPVYYDLYGSTLSLN